MIITLNHHIVLVFCSVHHYITHTQSSMIRYTFSHEYAGDLASLGIEYEVGDDDQEIIVNAPWSHPLTNDLKINSLCYHRYDY